MARRRKEAGHENHERWLVSYADFITLLFAFFVVMFASTQADKSKAKAVSDSVKEALANDRLSALVSTMLGRGKNQASDPLRDKPKVEGTENIPLSAPAGAAAAGDLSQSKKKLESGLEAELKNGKVQIKLEGRGLVVSLREVGFFASGDDTVQVAGYSIVGKVAAVVAALNNPVRLEGHTDARPIHNSRFRSNWELSTARGIAMLELLRDRFGIPAERLAVAGYAEFAPTDTNETDEGRAHNRRVDVVVLSEEAQKSEPHAVGRAAPAQAAGASTPANPPEPAATPAVGSAQPNRQAPTAAPANGAAQPNRPPPPTAAPAGGSAQPPRPSPFATPAVGAAQPNRTAPAAAAAPRAPRR